jgi:MFS family permease
MSRDDQDDRRDARRLAHSVTLATGLTVSLLSSHASAVATTLPAMATRLHVGMAAAGWVSTAYFLALGIALVPSGRLGDRLGYRGVFLAGITAFIIASAYCGMATSIGALIVGRAAQGIGGALIGAVSPAILTRSVPRERRGRAFGLQMGLTYVGLAVGPLAGALVMELAGWRGLFLVNVPIGTMVLFLAWRLLPGSSPASRGFVEPTLLHRVCLGAAVAELLFYACLYGTGFLLPIVLKDRNWSLIGAGTLLGGQAIARALAAPGSGVAADRFGTRWPAASGSILLALALVSLTVGGTSVSFYGLVGIVTALGCGTGLFVPANTLTLMTAAPEPQHGAAAALMATARTLGMALGVAVASLIYATFLTTQAGFAGMSVMGWLVVLLSAAVQQQVEATRDDSYVDRPVDGQRHRLDRPRTTRHEIRPVADIVSGARGL